MKKLVKVENGFYKTADGRFELRRERTRWGKRTAVILKLFEDGKYVGMPETVKMANEWLKDWQ